MSGCVQSISSEAEELSEAKGKCSRRLMDHQADEAYCRCNNDDDYQIIFMYACVIMFNQCGSHSEIIPKFAEALHVLWSHLFWLLCGNIKNKGKKKNKEH